VHALLSGLRNGDKRVGIAGKPDEIRQEQRGNAMPLSRKARFCALIATLLLVCGRAGAEEALRVGLILPMTGPFASTGKQVNAGVRLWMAQHGDTVAGRKVVILLRDDTGVAPEITRREAQELVVNDHADIIAGFGLTPLAFAAAPIATEAKVPMVVMAAGTFSITQKSPYIIRSGYTLVQYVAPLAVWAAENGVKRMYTLVPDYAPGYDAEAMFAKAFAAHGGTIVGGVRVPLQSPDYGPFVQRIKDAHPDAVFAFVPVGESAALMREFNARGLTEAGIRLICTGDVTDDDVLDGMGNPALGTISSLFYSAAHDSPENKSYVAAFEKANGGMRPNHMSVGGYDGMHLIYATLEKTKGNAGDSFMAAVKGLSWTSPRGRMTIDPNTRDPIQDVYIRKVERVDGHLYNVEFSRIPQVRNDGTPMAEVP
jgi:branched-chain amino acid transport system substrate-binding protein